jgi:hypothetical protein
LVTKVFSRAAQFARPDLGERWSSRLVATAAENRLNTRPEMPAECRFQVANNRSTSTAAFFTSADRLA